MIRFMVLIIAIGLIISCEKEDSDYTELINVTMFSIDEYSYTGYFEEEANISCIADTDVSGSYSLSITKYEKWVFNYKPPFDFTGSESFTFISSRLSKEDPDLLVIDSMRIVIEVLRDDFPDILIGEWKYIQSCGGYSGDCWNNYYGVHTIAFSCDLIYSSFFNDTLLESCHYEIVNGFRSGETAMYRIEYDNGVDSYHWFSRSRLKIQMGDFVNEFERIAKKASTQHME